MHLPDKTGLKEAVNMLIDDLIAKDWELRGNNGSVYELSLLIYLTLEVIGRKGKVDPIQIFRSSGFTNTGRKPENKDVIAHGVHGLRKFIFEKLLSLFKGHTGNGFGLLDAVQQVAFGGDQITVFVVRRVWREVLQALGEIGCVHVFIIFI